MKIRFTLSKPKGTIPKDYQHLLAGAFYDSLKKVSLANDNKYDDYHGKINVHVMSQLYGTKKMYDGSLIAQPNMDFLSWYIASPDHDMLLQVCSQLWKKKTLILGSINILKFDILLPITSEKTHRFLAQSPIILKKNINNETHYYVVDDGGEKTITKMGKKSSFHIHRDNEACAKIMKENILHKARVLNVKINEGFKIYFDENYKKKKVRNVIVKKSIKAFTSTCPVIVEADNETINFISEIGLGNSTAMGFGYI